MNDQISTLDRAVAHMKALLAQMDCIHDMQEQTDYRGLQRAEECNKCGFEIEYSFCCDAPVDQNDTDGKCYGCGLPTISCCGYQLDDWGICHDCQEHCR